MRRLPLPDQHAWPEVDRALWLDLITPAAGPFDDPGALSHLSWPSLRNIAVAYDRWLSWLSEEIPEVLLEPPAQRGTPERLLAWTGSLTSLAPMSRWFYVNGAVWLLRAAAPEADWSVQKRLAAWHRSEAFRDHGHRKKGRILSSEVLLEAGLDLAGLGADAAPTPFRAMIARRDGLMVAFLALMPLRITSFSTLELGRSVLRMNGGWVIAVDRDHMKSGRPWEAPLPPMLVEPFTRYVDEVRPWLMRRAKTPHKQLWIGDRSGRPYTTTTLGLRIGDLTEELLGVRVPPHFFRDAAATTLVRASPEDAQAVRPLLGHTTYGTGERHYIHAKGIEAIQQYADLVARLDGQAS